MKNKLLVISILLIIIICYYWLNKHDSSIETYVNNTTNIYIRNLNNDGTVNPILDSNSSSRTEMLQIYTFKGVDIDIYIGEGIEEINGFFNQESLSSMKEKILNVYFPSTLKKIGVNEFKDYKNLDNVILPPGIIEIQANAFRGTAIKHITLPNIRNFNKELYNHTNKTNMNQWLSFRPFIVYNAYLHVSSNKINEIDFKDKWVIVYNNKYYLTTSNFYTVFVNHKDKLVNTSINNDTIVENNKYMVKNYIIKKNQDFNNIFKFLYSNKLLYPFEDNVIIKYVTREENTNFEKHEYTDPITTHIQTIEEYITDTENVQIATYRNVKDLHNIEGNSSQDGYLSVDKGQTDRDYLIINIVDGAVALGESLFENNSYLETIIIPSSVKYIKDKCFKSCTNLKRILFYPVSQLISIGNRAFAGCTNLKTIHLPDKLQTIGYEAFKGCSDLQVYINPSSQLKVVAMDAFDETISKLVLPAQTHIAPIINKEIYKLSLRATTNMITSIDDTTLQSRYVSQSVLEDSNSNNFLLSVDGKTINETQYNKQKTYNIYQNKITNQVYININHSPYITEPLYYRYIFWEANEHPENISFDPKINLWWTIGEFEVWNQDDSRISHTLNPTINWSSKYYNSQYHDYSPSNINNDKHFGKGHGWAVSFDHQSIKNVFGETSGKPRSFIGYDFKSPQHIKRVRISDPSQFSIKTNQNINGYKLYFTNHIKTIKNPYKNNLTPFDYTCVDSDKPYIVITSYDYDKTYQPFTVNHDNNDYELRSFNHNITETSSHTIQTPQYFITVPFPIDYYNTNTFSSDVLETQTQDIQSSITAIQEAEGNITNNIQIIRERINQLSVPELINDMNNAYGMNDLPSLTDFNAIISTINNYVNDTESQFKNVIIETNKEKFQLELAALIDNRDELQTQVTDALATNTARIEKRLKREADLAGSETQRVQEINQLKQDAVNLAEEETQTWFNQYKTNYNLQELDNTITNKEDSIQLYHQNVKDSNTLKQLDNKLNNLDEVYERVNDQNMSTEIERNMIDLEFKNIGKETEARKNELQKLQEEDIKLKEENKQIKNRMKLIKLDETISHNNMELKHVNDTIKQQDLFMNTVKDLIHDKKNKLNILGHAFNTGDEVIESQQQLIVDNLKEQDKYQIEKFTNLNKYNMKYMDPKYEEYRLNQEDCDQLLDEFKYDKYCEEPYYNYNKDKCIKKEICKNKNHNNELENEIYNNPGTRMRFKDYKDNYHYNYTNTINMSLGILTLFTIIYKIK